MGRVTILDSPRLRPGCGQTIAESRRLRITDEAEADFSMLSGAVHDDPGITDDFTWTKQQTTGIAARVAAHLLWPPL